MALTRDHDAALPTPGCVLDGCPACETHGPAVPWSPSLDPPRDPPGASHTPSFGPPSQRLAMNTCEQVFVGRCSHFTGIHTHERDSGLRGSVRLPLDGGFERCRGVRPCDVPARSRAGARHLCPHVALLVLSAAWRGVCSERAVIATCTSPNDVACFCMSSLATWSKVLLIVLNWVVGLLNFFF